MICTGCGNEYADDIFCPHCGLASGQSQAVYPNYDTSSEYYQQEAYNTPAEDYQQEAYVEDYQQEPYVESYQQESYSEGYQQEAYSEDYQQEPYVEGYQQEAYVEDYQQEAYSEDYQQEAYSEDYQQEAYVEGYQQGAYSEDYQHEAYSEDYQQETYSEDYQQEAYSEEYQQEAYSPQFQPESYDVQPQQQLSAYNNVQPQSNNINPRSLNPSNPVYSSGNSTPYKHVTQKKSKWPIYLSIGILCITLVAITIGVISGMETRDLRSDNDEAADNSNNTTSYYDDNDDNDDDVTTTQTTTEAAITTSAPTTEVQATVPETKTIMIYMVGSDLESEGSNATKDLIEISESGYDDTTINILVLAGGSSLWHHEEITHTTDNGLYIFKDGSLEYLGNITSNNMGDSSTLTTFLDYGYENYPADQYGVIFWDHGGGPINGYGCDEIHNDLLYHTEMSQALSESCFSSSNKLEFIGFDACLMANIETAHSLSPYANYLIASQEVEPGCGWHYQFLSEIDIANNGEEIGKLICDYYVDECMANGTFYNCDITLSVLDLNAISPVINALDDLFYEVNNNLSSSTFATYANAKTSSKKVHKDDRDLIDFKDYVETLSSTHPTEATALSNALDDFIIYNCSEFTNEYGVSIFHPYYNLERLESNLSIYNDYSFSPEYQEYVNTFSDLLTSDTVCSANWDMSTLKPVYNGGYDFYMQLSAEQAEEISYAYYVISTNDPDDPERLMFVGMESSTITIDSTYTLYANYDGTRRCIRNLTTGDLYSAMYKQHEVTESYCRYLVTCKLYNDDFNGDDTVSAYYVLETTPSNPEGEFVGLYYAMDLLYGDEDIEDYQIGTESRAIDPNDYQNIAWGNYSHKFSGTENLQEFESSDWEDVVLYYNNFPESDGYEATITTLNPNLNYYAMFIIEDVQGNRHMSQLVQIQ